MKNLFIGLSLFTSLTVFAADDNKVSKALTDIQAAQDQVQLLLAEVTGQAKEHARIINAKLTTAEILLRQSLGQPQPPQPDPNQTVEMYRSDSCSSSFVGNIHPTTNCQKFAGSENVWAIKVNGQCTDISDMSAVTACQMYQNAGNPDAIRVYKSDSCSSSLSGIFSTYSDCEALPATSGNDAWAVRLNGQCHDLSDMPVKMSCRAFKAASSPNNVRLYHSDSCSSSLLAVIDRYTDCASLKGLQNVWAVYMNGQCQDISDSEIVQVCNRFQPMQSFKK
jgi:uncharacterized membrane protein